MRDTRRRPHRLRSQGRGSCAATTHELGRAMLGQQKEGGLTGPRVYERRYLSAGSTEKGDTRSRLPRSRQPEVLGSCTSRAVWAQLR